MSDLTYSHQNILFQSVVWRRRRHVAITCWYPPPRLHDVTVQKTTLWTLIALKTYNTHLAYQTLWFGMPAHLLKAKFNFRKTVFSLFLLMRSHKNWNHILPAHVRVN